MSSQNLIFILIKLDSLKVCYLSCGDSCKFIAHIKIIFHAEGNISAFLIVWNIKKDLLMLMDSIEK